MLRTFDKDIKMKRDEEDTEKIREADFLRHCKRVRDVIRLNHIALQTRKRWCFFTRHVFESLINAEKNLNMSKTHNYVNINKIKNFYHFNVQCTHHSKY